MSGQPVDFSKYESAAPVAIDFSKYEAATPPPQASAFQRLGESSLSGAGVVSNEQGKNFFLHPLDTLKAMANLQGELGERAKKELANKDYVRGLTHGVEWLIPGLGPTLAHSGDQLESGDIAGGVGTTLGAAATLLAGAKAPAIAEGASDAAGAAASSVKPALAKAGSAATAIGESLDPDVVGLVSPRAAHALRLANKVGKVASKLGTAVTPEVEPVYPGASLPEHPGTFPGAPEPTAAPEQINPSLVSPARSMPGQIGPERIFGPKPTPAQPIPSRPGLQLSGEVAQPEVTPPAATSEAAPPAASDANIPRTLSGDSALRQVLTGQDNANLLKIAKSRGLNVTRESQLKPGTADNLLVNKIVNDFSPEELGEIRDQYLENTRMGKHDFGDIGPEAWKTMGMQAYFPNVKIPLSAQLRTTAAIAKAGSPKLAPVTDLAATLKSNAKAAAGAKPAASAAAPEAADDLTQILQESLKRAQARANQ